MCESCRNYRAFIHQLRNGFGQVSQYGQLAALCDKDQASPAIEVMKEKSEEKLVENINRFAELLRKDPNEKV